MIKGNVIAFSLFGNKDKYNIGVLRNIELAKTIYEGWRVVVFHDNTLSENIIKQIGNDADLINVDGNDMTVIPPMPGMLWRFFINDYPLVERFIVRDADSRLLIREKEAVDEWIVSGKKLHLMRDHPHHTQKIFGGMWGMVVDKEFSFIKEISRYVENKHTELEMRMVDMNFLAEIIYDRYKNDTIVHQSIEYLNEQFVVPFPSEMVDYRFVGEIINADESREYQYTLWKDLKEKR